MEPLHKQLVAHIERGALSQLRRLHSAIRTPQFVRCLTESGLLLLCRFLRLL